MSSLNDAINFVLSQSEKAASIQLSSPSLQVTEQLERSKRIAGTKRKLIRDADSSECKLFAVSTTEATRINTDAIHELVARESQASRPNVERILSAAISLNEICHDPNSTAKIEDLRQVLEDQQINLDYLDTTYQKNRVEDERLTRLAAEMSPVAIEQQAEDSGNERDRGKQPTARPEAQQEKELEDLEKEIAAKKEELRKHQEEASREAELMQAESKREEEDEQEQKPVEPAQTEAQDWISRIKAQAKSILSNDSVSWKERFSEIRKELVRQILSEDTDGSEEISNDVKVMARVIELLEAESNKTLLLANIKAAAGSFATSLGLPENAGTQAIYKLGAHKIVHINRSQKESVVQLLY